MKHLILLIPLCLPIFGSAQKNTSFGVGGGMASPGYVLTLNYNLISSDMSNLRVKALVIQSIYKTDFYTVPYNTFTLDAGYYYNIYKNKTRSICINIGGSGTAGYQLLNGGKKVLDTGEELAEGQGGLIYGITFGGEAEIFVTDRLGVFANLDQYYYFNSTIIKLNTFIGAGLKLYF